MNKYVFIALCNRDNYTIFQEWFLEKKLIEMRSSLIIQMSSKKSIIDVSVIADYIHYHLPIVTFTQDSYYTHNKVVGAYYEREHEELVGLCNVLTRGEKIKNLISGYEYVR